MKTHLQGLLSILGLLSIGLLLVACGSDISASNKPQVEVTVDGTYKLKKEFLPDMDGSGF